MVGALKAPRSSWIIWGEANRVALYKNHFTTYEASTLEYPSSKSHGTAFGLNHNKIHDPTIFCALLN